MEKKLKLGVYSFTCCEGCTIVFIEMLNSQFDWLIKRAQFVDFRALKTFKEVSETDVAFVEGAISTKSEVRKLREIRKKTKKLIAFGSGAVSGFPSNMRNDFSKDKLKLVKERVERFEQLKKVEPLKKFVKVDYELDGCPISEEDLVKVLKKVVKNA